MSLTVDSAMALLRNNVDLDEDMAKELSERLAAGEYHTKVWSKNDGTITIRLIGEEGKTLGEPGDFRDLLQAIIERWDEVGPDDVHDSAHYKFPELTANVSFGG